jgi:hypothetical protein
MQTNSSESSTPQVEPYQLGNASGNASDQGGVEPHHRANVSGNQSGSTVAEEDEATATAASIRVEMARRALSGDVGDEDQGGEQPVNEAFDSDLISGATAELSEAGYLVLATLCCPLEMSLFAERVVQHLGFVVCNEGSLNGMVAWFYCKNQTRTFAELVADSINAANGECAWVGSESKCPTMSENCPHFPDNGAHRRRNCGFRKIVNTTTSKEPPAFTTMEAPFSCDLDIATSLDFGRSNLTVNNLGGNGPDDSGSSSLIYQGIATYQGSSVDLVIRAEGDYVAADTAENGIRDQHGQINVMSGHAVELVFSFRYSATKAEVVLPEFYFTLLDMDQSDTKHQERVYINGFAHAIHEDINDFEAEMLMDGRTLYKSLQSGETWDDPPDPGNLGVVADPENSVNTVDQRKRAAMLVFRDTSRFTVTLEVSDSDNVGVSDSDDSTGRNFIFSGESSLIDLCQNS